MDKIFKIIKKNRMVEIQDGRQKQEVEIQDGRNSSGLYKKWIILLIRLYYGCMLIFCPF